MEASGSWLGKDILEQMLKIKSKLSQKAILTDAQRELILGFLGEIESLRPLNIAEILSSFLNMEDFAVKLKTIIALGRCGDAKALPFLLNFMKDEQATHWRLAALDSILLCPYENGQKAKALADFLPQDDKIFLRGIIWSLGNLGQAAFPYLLDFLKDETWRYIKEDIIAEAFYLAAGQDPDILLKLQKENADFRRFSLYRIWPESPLPKFSLYPYPDYLWLKAKEKGLSKGDFKSLYFWYRKKA